MRTGVFHAAKTVGNRHDSSLSHSPNANLQLASMVMHNVHPALLIERLPVLGKEHVGLFHVLRGHWLLQVALHYVLQTEEDGGVVISASTLNVGEDRGRFGRVLQPVGGLVAVRVENQVGLTGPTRGLCLRVAHDWIFLMLCE